MDDEIDEAFADVDESYSPDSGDERRTWHVDDPELESDKTAEGVKEIWRKNSKKGFWLSWLTVAQGSKS